MSAHGIGLRRRRALACLGFLLICLAAYGDGNIYQQRIDDFASNPLAKEADQFPRESYKTLDELVAHQGKPERTVKIPDRQVFREGDYWLGLEYPALYLQYYYSSLKDAFFVRLRRFFDNGKDYKYGIRIGMPEEELMQILGLNSRKERSEVGKNIWYYPDAGNVQLLFRFSYRNELEEITIMTEGAKGSQ